MKRVGTLISVTVDNGFVSNWVINLRALVVLVFVARTLFYSKPCFFRKYFRHFSAPQKSREDSSSDE